MQGCTGKKNGGRGIITENKFKSTRTIFIYIYINININLGQLILGKIAISFHEIDCKSGGSIMEVELSTERYEQTILLKYSWK